MLLKCIRKFTNCEEISLDKKKEREGRGLLPDQKPDYRIKHPLPT